MSGFWRGAEDDIEAGGEFADGRTVHGVKINGDEVARFCVDIFPDAVLFVPCISLDVALGGEQFLAALFDLEMNVRGASGVRNGFNGAEIIFAGGTGEEAAEALEVCVALGVLISGV